MGNGRSLQSAGVDWTRIFSRHWNCPLICGPFCIRIAEIIFQPTFCWIHHCGKFSYPRTGPATNFMPLIDAVRRSNQEMTGVCSGHQISSGRRSVSGDASRGIGKEHSAAGNLLIGNSRRSYVELKRHIGSPASIRPPIVPANQYAVSTPHTTVASYRSAKIPTADAPANATQRHRLKHFVGRLI